MADYEVSDIADLVQSTRKKEGVGKLTDLTTDLQYLVALSELIANNKVTEDGGEKLKVNIMTTTSGAARAVGLHSVDVPVRGDVLDDGEVPWRHVETSFYIDIREPILNSGSENRILNFLDVKRMDAVIDLQKLWEQIWWGKPATSSDKITPFGIDYWMTYPSSYSTPSFCGGNPSGFSSGAAGIDSDTYDRWCNWYFEFADITQADLVDKLCQAFYKCGFRAPMPNPPITEGSRPTRYGLYTTFDMRNAMRHLLRDQNDDLGNDLAAKDDQIMFHGTQIVAVPFLDDDNDIHSDMAAYDPIYGIDWGVMEFVVLEGWFNKETNRPAPNQHNSLATWIDTSCNTRCRNRRKLFLGSLAI